MTAAPRVAALPRVAAGIVHCFRDPLAITRLVRAEAIAARAPLARGLLVDVGAGRQPYAALFASRVRRIIAVEFPGGSPRAAIDVIADAHALPVRAGVADTVLCVEVLEYLVDPRSALRELARILAPRGVLLLTAPQIRGASDEPNDYWRFGRAGLALLAAEAGLTDVRVDPCGGLFAACGQRASSALWTSLARQLPRAVVRALCGAVQAPAWLVDQAGAARDETLHWMLTARKP
jgi:SAM-dependent methyltransferase